MALLSHDDIHTALVDLPGWRFEHDAVTRTFSFVGFPEAVAFVTRLVPGAEAADHHPDLVINYRRVTVTFTTPSEGGVTDRDIAGARMADACA